MIYEVPWRHYSLASAIDRGALVSRTPINGIDSEPLIPYVAAIDNDTAPALTVTWPDDETMVISGTVSPHQIVSVREEAHFGWHATVGGSPRRMFTDRLGFMAVEPGCDGPCIITLHYDGGTEMTVARWISRCALAGSLPRMLRGADLDSQQESEHGRKGDTPLIGAASLGAEEVGLSLLEAGARLEPRGFFGETALHWAGLLGEDRLAERIIRISIADLNLKDDKYNSPPLGWAIHGCYDPPAGNHGRQREVAALLVSAGAIVEPGWLESDQVRADAAMLAALGGAPQRAIGDTKVKCLN